MDNKFCVFKGLSEDQIEGYFKKKNIIYTPILEKPFNERINLINKDLNYQKELAKRFNRIISSDNAKHYYLTYEEFLLIYDLIMFSFSMYDLDIKIIRNNFYPNYYSKKFSKEEIILLDKMIDYQNSAERFEERNNLDNSLIGYVLNVNGSYYYSYKDIDLDERITHEDLYHISDFVPVIKKNIPNGYHKIEVNSEPISILRLLETLKDNSINKLAVIFNKKTLDITKNLKNLGIIYSIYKKMKNIIFSLPHFEKIEVRDDFANMLKDIWGFESFKKINVYSSIGINKDTTPVRQDEIIESIVRQTESCQNKEKYRDVFITAPTGSGKSVIFQIPALYIAKKYKLLTIVVSPLIALMKDQIHKIKNKGIRNAEYLNSELSFTEKETIFGRIKDGEIDIIYLSPESLLSYRIESIVGNRKLGLVIVDEAHTVSTWGKNFRPDYWYLGNYLRKIKRVNHHCFPICTFTATAVCGGPDDMQNDIISSLDMVNPIVFMGCVRKDNIVFDIKTFKLDKDKKENYESVKLVKLFDRLKKNVDEKKKSIYYFPFASDTRDIYYEAEDRELSDELTYYTGKIEKVEKNKAYIMFKKNMKTQLFATKAFGMGVDIEDLDCIYHYAPTGTLSDYIQEIGRVARKHDVIGEAGIDFSTNDFRFTKTLNSMNSTKNYQIKQVIKKIIDMYYINKKRSNFLVTSMDFSHIFPKEKNERDLEKRVKTALMMVEKDLESKYSYPPVICRPKSVFSKVYYVINENKKNEIINSEFGKFFKYYRSGNNNKNGNIKKYDAGNIYIFDMKGIWENYFPNYSFPQFKYKFFNRENEIAEKFVYLDYVHQRIKVNIKTDEKLGDLKEKIADKMLKVNKVLDTLRLRRKDFIISEFQSELNKTGYFKPEIIKNITGSYLQIMEKVNRSTFKIFAVNVMRFRLKNDTYNKISRGIIYNNKILDLIENVEKNEKEIFIPNERNKDDANYIYILPLIELFELGTFDIIGGGKP